MWKKLYDLLGRLVTLTERISRHDKQIEELRGEVRQLAGLVHRLVVEINRLSDRQTAESEKTHLWVENQILRFEQRLPQIDSRAGGSSSVERG